MSRGMLACGQTITRGGIAGGWCMMMLAGAHFDHFQVSCHRVEGSFSPKGSDIIGGEQIAV